MTTLSTVLTVIMIVLALAAATFAIAAWLGGGRSAQGGPRVGSLDRDEDHEPPTQPTP